MAAVELVHNKRFLETLKNNKTAHLDEVLETPIGTFNGCCEGTTIGLTLGLSLCLCYPCRVGYCSHSLRTCGCWCPFGGPLLFWSVYHENLFAVQSIVDYGVDLGVKLKNGETVLDYAEKYKASPEILDYLKHAIANPAPISASMGRFADTVLAAITRKQKKYAAFLTHHKRDAAAVVGPLRHDICARLGVNQSYVFLDSENLRDLRGLRDAVRSTLVLVVLLTKDVFTRPWCLVEIYTAIEMQIPIISVNIEGQGNPFNFQETQAYLQSHDFAARLEQVNPGASNELLSQEIDPNVLGQKVGAYMPYIIAKSYNVSASERVRDAQLIDIVDVLMEKM